MSRVCPRGIGLNLFREFNSIDCEVWRVRRNETDTFLVIKDERRPSELSDYPWLSEHETPFFEPKDNVIHVSYLVTPNISLGLELIAEVFEVVEQLLHHVAMAACDIILTPHTFPSESDCLNYIQKILHHMN